MKNFIILCLLIISACQARQREISTNIYSTTGSENYGKLTLTDTAKGLHVTGALENLPKGEHGFHIHEKGSCDAARDAEGKTVPALAAGGHYDPMKTGKHAGPEKGGHKGDLPLIMADKNGRAEIDFYQKNLTLDEIKNRSIMIHAGGDNYQDQPLPLGGGGARIGCGVIK